MAYYLLQIAFMPEAAAVLLKDPESRLEALRPEAEEMGGGIEDGWLAFGEYDIVLLLEMPDNARAAAFSAAISTDSAVKAIKATPLMTIGEGRQAAQRSTDAPSPFPGAGDESEMTSLQVQELIAPNLEYAAACAESAYHVIKELGLQGTVPTVNTAIAHGLHFLQLAQHYLEGLQQQMRQPPGGAREDA